MNIIEVEKLSKTYESYRKQPGFLNSLKSFFKREKIQVPAVKEISLSIKEGEFVGFLGPNGAGKTTTLKMLSGILFPTSGSAHVLGFVPWERHVQMQKQFAIVMGQKNQLWWDLPATETFLLNKEIYEISDHDYHERLDELVELLDMKDFLDIPVRKLSLGQRMKCELVAALLHNPKVLFLDEPTIGLDVVSQNKMREFLRKYNKEKKVTIILTSHYMEDIEALCERVIVINHGELIYDGQLHQLTEKYITSKILEISFTQEIDLKEFQQYGEVKEGNSRHLILKVDKNRSKDIASKILNSYPVDDILINEQDVESVIRTIFTEKK